MYAIGMMSGTSLDNVDIVLCEIEGSGLNTKLKVIAYEEYPIPDDLKQKVLNCADNVEQSAAYYCSLNFELGELFGDVTNQFLKINDFPKDKIAFIASHGQTIYHIPLETEQYAKSTLQMGESAVIATKTGIPVIDNFRVMDMANGGQGAPLVPYSEWILYQSASKNRGLQNLGGIGNMTVIPKNAAINDLFAFDTGPANMMIDRAMTTFFGQSYDKNGEIGLSGKLIDELKEELKKHPYLKEALPKTSGREMFGNWYADELIAKYFKYRPEDIVATFTWFTSYCISFHYQNFIKPELTLDEIILSGGGSHNQAIIYYLGRLLPDVTIVTQEDIGYSSDAKEAIAFAILGNETWHRQTSNVPGATGADKRVVLGKIQYV